MKRVVGMLAHVHTDGRRAIHEMNSPNGGFAVTGFVVTAQIPLGNHYHARKSETFVITKGGGQLILQSVNDEGNLVGEREEYQLQAGSVTYIGPRVAHTFVLDPGSEMICYSSAAFDENDKDLMQVKLV